MYWELMLADVHVFVLVLIKRSRVFQNSKVTNSITSYELPCDYVILNLGFTLLPVI